MRYRKKYGGYNTSDESLIEATIESLNRFKNGLVHSDRFGYILMAKIDNILMRKKWITLRNNKYLCECAKMEAVVTVITFLNSKSAEYVSGMQNYPAFLDRTISRSLLKSIGVELKHTENCEYIDDCGDFIVKESIDND